MNRLASIRNEKKVTQQKVADFLGVSRSQYGHYETGHTSMDGDTLMKLSSFFGVSVDYLLGLSDDPTPTATGAAIGYGSKEYVINGLSKEEFEELQNYLEYQRSKAKK